MLKPAPLLLAVTVLASGLGLVASDADACGVFYMPTPPKPPKRQATPVKFKPAKPAPAPAPEMVAAAYDALDARTFAAIGPDLARSFASLGVDDAKAAGFGARGARVLAVAIARTKGAPGGTGAGPTLAGATGVNTTARIAWARDVLQALNDRTPNEPTLEANLAEVQALDPTTEATARATLHDLAANDLLGSPDALATLARLEAKSGDDAARDDALAGCRRSATVAVACTLGAPTVAGAAKPVAFQTVGWRRPDVTIKQPLASRDVNGPTADGLGNTPNANALGL